MRGLLLAAALLSATFSQNAAHAQSKTQQVGGFTIKASNTIARPNGVRLEGSASEPVHLQSPQLDLTAPAMALDYVDKQVTQLRAIDGVSFKLNLAGADPIKIEAKSQTATLDALPVNGRRTLRLTGNVDGFYESKGARNTLSGERATITFGEGDARDILVQVAGGTNGVQLQIASALFGSEAALGDVTLRADNADIDEKSGTATFKGNASIVSKAQPSDGTQNFNIKAPAFVANFKAENGRQTLQNVRTQGRASIVIDAPPAAGASQSTPTHFEVQADNATVEPQAQNLVLEGNVSGFYDLPAENVATPVRYNFSDVDKAIARFVTESQKTADTPAGLNFQALGKPASFQIPGFDLGLK